MSEIPQIERIICLINAAREKPFETMKTHAQMENTRLKNFCFISRQIQLHHQKRR